MHDNIPGLAIFEQARSWVRQYDWGHGLVGNLTLKFLRPKKRLSEPTITWLTIMRT